MMRSLLQLNRSLQGRKKILYWCSISTGKNHATTKNNTGTGQTFHCFRTIVTASQADQKTNPKREKNEGKEKKTSIRLANATPDSTLEHTLDEEEQPPLVPWLRNLWKSHSNGSVSDSSTSAPIVTSMIAASEAYALATPDCGDRKTRLKDNKAIDSDTYDGDHVPMDTNETPTADRVSSWDKSINDPRESWPIDPNIYPHVRTSLTDIKLDSERELLTRDTGLSICTLGTGAGGSCRLRSNAATVVRSGSFSYLIDAGEGVHRQFMLSRLNYNDVCKIFITHMHADHVIGLPTILLSIQTARLNENSPKAVDLYGPVGLYNYVAMALAITCSEIRKLKVSVYELHGGTQRSMRFSGNRKAFPEFQHKGLTRKAIPQNTDGTWTLVEPQEITTPELASSKYSEPTGFSVKAGEIHHIPELQTFGYTFQEPTTQPRPLNIDAARKLGVSMPESFRILKSGFSAMNDDKSRLVHSDEVCGQANRPRKITVLGDCSLVPPAMEKLAEKSDVLVHEATLSLQDSGKKAVNGGHSTAAQAAIFANKVKAQVLILNHLPKTLNTFAKCKEWLKEAESRIRGPTRVQLGYDHLEILIPRNGFNFNEVEASQSLWPGNRIRVGDTIQAPSRRVNGKGHVQGWR